MEGKSSPIENLDTTLIKKHWLVAGRKVVFKKTAINSSSSIPVGNTMSGFLDSDVAIGLPISLDNGKGIISNIKRVEERNSDLFIITNTSEYQLIYNFDDIAGVETAKGSVYKYLEDGTTQRFKKVENKKCEPQSELVYVPDFNYIKSHVTPEELVKLGKSKEEYVLHLLEYVQGDNRNCYIVNGNGRKIETNQGILDEKGDVYLAFGDENKTHFIISVSLIPKIDFYTYDSRKFRDEEKGTMIRERHLGNQVVKIIRKGESFS
jgi:hypothetical protein